MADDTQGSLEGGVTPTEAELATPQPRTDIERYRALADRIALLPEIARNLGTDQGPNRLRLIPYEELEGMDEDQMLFELERQIGLMTKVGEIRQQIVEKSIPELEALKTRLRRQIMDGLAKGIEELRGRSSQGFIYPPEMQNVERIFEALLEKSRGEPVGPDRTRFTEESEDFKEDEIPDNKVVILPDGTRVTGVSRPRQVLLQTLIWYASKDSPLTSADLILEIFRKEIADDAKPEDFSAAFNAIRYETEKFLEANRSTFPYTIKSVVTPGQTGRGGKHKSYYLEPLETKDSGTSAPGVAATEAKRRVRRSLVGSDGLVNMNPAIRVESHEEPKTYRMTKSVYPWVSEDHYIPLQLWTLPGGIQVYVGNGITKEAGNDITSPALTLASTQTGITGANKDFSTHLVSLLSEPGKAVGKATNRLANAVAGLQIFYSSMVRDNGRRVYATVAREMVDGKRVIIRLAACNKGTESKILGQLTFKDQTALRESIR